jgi:hypothetical protein
MKRIIAIGIIFILLLLNISISPAYGIKINKENMDIKPKIMSKNLEDYLTIYDFNGITSPSSSHIASHKLRIMDLNDRPPTSGPIINNQEEFNTENYHRIYENDESKVETTSSIGKQLHHFKFKINEEISEIKELSVRWFGHASNTHVNLYIWNFDDNSWELLGVNRLTHEDAPISKTIISSIPDYIDETDGCLYLVAITRAATFLKQQLYTNYVQVKVGNPTTVTLKDNAYHYNNEEIYIEWWFFQVVNETEDIQFYISFSVVNPENGHATADIGVYEREEIYEIRENFPMEDFYASYNKPDVKIGDNFLEALDENTILTEGILNDGKNRAIWNLTFERTAPPYDFIESAGETEYLCYLPGAWVNGTIKLNDVLYSMNNSYGYQDHNWGGGPYIPTQWAWAAVCKPNDKFALAMEKVEHFAWHTRALYVTYEDLTVYFEDIDTAFKEFKFDFKLSFPFFTYYPKIREIHAENDEGYVIDFKATVQKNLPVFMGIPRVLNEQISLFEGILSKDGQTIYSLNVIGLTDYSTF